MPRPKVIIADTDLNYIIPIQLKFVEEYFERIDLELITDRDLFHNKFTAPQNADILVIADGLYEPSLQKHNIGKIFLMTEQEDTEHKEGSNVTEIYKYTNIKTIFSKITSGLKNTDLSVQAQSTQLVLVTSADGGAGKTAISLALSKCLALMEKKVLYINADYLQSFQYWLSNTTSIRDQDIYAKLAEPENMTYSAFRHAIRKEDFYYLPPFNGAIMSEGLHFSIYEKICKEAMQSNEYDFVIVDAIHTFDENNAKLMRSADKVILLTRQNVKSAFSAVLLVANINGFSNEKYLLVCNDFDQTKENAYLLNAFAQKITISEYIEHIPNCERKSIDEIAKSSGVQKVAYLIA